MYEMHLTGTPNISDPLEQKDASVQVDDQATSTGKELGSAQKVINRDCESESYRHPDIYKRSVHQFTALSNMYHLD